MVAVIDTSAGELRCQLFPEEAPVAVANFVGLSRGTIPWTDPETGALREDPLFVGTVFHRVIPGFMVQAGDPEGTGSGGPWYRFMDEISASKSFDGSGVTGGCLKSMFGGEGIFMTELTGPGWVMMQSLKKVTAARRQAGAQ
ncbi:MAG: peptidylprolyl isomerase [Deltaproteobacteria bacterium]|nr:peptidylprolyl isomerase [Deltaproteobacteria bacterium]